MAKFLRNKGSNRISRSGIIVDAFVDNGSTFIDIEQPAGSVLVSAKAHILDTAKSTGNGNWGYKIGTTTDDDAFSIDVDGFDATGTGPLKNTLVDCPISGSLTAAAVGTAAPGYADDARSIRCTATCSDVTSVDDAGKVAFTLFFEILPV
jgi:hypothetical protein